MSASSPHPDWLTAAELSALALPSMGSSRRAVLHKALKEGWHSRLVPGGGGQHYEFHIRSLPRDALEGYAERLLGPDVVAPLKQVKDSFTAGFKDLSKGGDGRPCHHPHRD